MTEDVWRVAGTGYNQLTNGPSQKHCDIKLFGGLQREQRHREHMLQIVNLNGVWNYRPGEVYSVLQNIRMPSGSGQNTSVLMQQLKNYCSAR